MVGARGGRSGSAGAGVHPQKFIFVFYFFVAIRDVGAFVDLFLIV